MSPPRSEQLIRDYLNRLSMAGRVQLSAEDRRALVDRTGDFIERSVGEPGQADPRQVAALLARLGDPAVIAELEYTRLAVIRGEAELPPAPARRGRVPAIRIRPEPGTASWHWPRAAGHPRLLDQILTAVSAGGPAAGNGGVPIPAAASASNGTEAGHEVAVVPGVPARNAAEAGNGVVAPPAESAGNGSTPGDGTSARPDVPAAHGSAAAGGEPSDAESPDAEAGNGAAMDEPTAESGSIAASKPLWPTGVKMTSEPLVPGFGEPAETLELEQEPEFEQEPDLGQEPEPGPVEPARARAEAMLKDVRRWIGDHPREAIAAFLIGFGGLIYPPVWILGAIWSFASRKWDYRDRWIALALPVVLVVVGTSLGVSLGHRHASLSSYVHEGWVYADILSRILAVLGAYYLVWRVDHPRRIPIVPPWNRPHRVG
jgi:hypothetical protein